MITETEVRKETPLDRAIRHDWASDPDMPSELSVAERGLLASLLVGMELLRSDLEAQHGRRIFGSRDIPLEDEALRQWYMVYRRRPGIVRAMPVRRLFQDVGGHPLCQVIFSFRDISRGASGLVWEFIDMNDMLLFLKTRCLQSFGLSYGAAINVRYASRSRCDFAMKTLVDLASQRGVDLSRCRHKAIRHLLAGRLEQAGTIGLVELACLSRALMLDVKIRLRVV